MKKTRILSNRELQILEMVSYGHTNPEIATSLAISIETVKGHVKSLLWKLEASSRAHAVAIALRRRLIT